MRSLKIAPCYAENRHCDSCINDIELQICERVFGVRILYYYILLGIDAANANIFVK